MMSLKDQLALGKNTILQKKCDQTCVKFRRDFRQTRRRINTLEEDCVKSLYHLLLDAKGQNTPGSPAVQDKDKTKDTNTRTTKSAIYAARHRKVSQSERENTEEIAKPPRRPATSMSVRNYHISYSFVKNGLDIAKVQRDKLESSDKIKTDNMNGNINHSGINPISQRRANTAMSFAHSESNAIDQRPPTAGIEINITDTGLENDLDESFSPSSRDNGLRPVTAGVYLKTSTPLTRPQISNTLRDPVTPAPRNSETVTLAKQDVNLNGSTSELFELNPKAHLRVRPATVLGNVTRSAFPVEEDRLDSKHANINVNATSDDESYNAVSDSEALVGGETPEPSPRLGDDEEIFFNGHRNANSTQCTPSYNRSNSSVARIYARPRSKRKSAKSIDRESETETVLQQSADKTQRFLKEYAKKSKLFSYVVNADISSAHAAGPRERKIQRSPNVTYQELVSIKANIKKQMTQTKVILQKSARLSNYVNKLTGLGVSRAQRVEQT